MLDDYPANYLAAASRLHRWVRGDWQTLPWLGPTVVGTDGKASTRNPLSPLHRWKMLDNLRRSLVSPTTAAAVRASAGCCCPDAALSWPMLHAAARALPGVLLAGRRDGLPAHAA